MENKKGSKMQQSALEGVISISSKGTGYISLPENQGKKDKSKNDVEINFRDLNTALNGDIVEFVLHPKKESRQSGEVTKIVSRAKLAYSGVLEEENGIFFLNPDDSKMYTDIIVPEKMLSGAKTGDKVFGEIISWNDPRKLPEGKIIKIFGKTGDNDAEMRAIAMEKGFDEKLPQEVEKEAEQIRKMGITEKDLVGRKDFRGTLTITIDPADAKDFDDAISFKELDGGLLEVGVHIADVTHYVKIDSELDKEAKNRGTSVYLVDRTIPMLPEALSNDLCSLVPNKDRLTMSAVFVIDKDGDVKNTWFGESIIHSDVRLSYEQAEESIKKSSLPYHRELNILNNIAKKLTIQKFKNGAITLDQEEVKFVLDEKGMPIKVIKKERGDSNRLIEEFMLLANRQVAQLVALDKKGVPFVYRVHDLPSKEKMEDLAFFLKSLGYKVTLQNSLIPSHQINKILKDLEGKNEKDTIHRAVIRSMAKAIYSTKNIGHYGLAFKYYTHFTSPIRRYPDMIVHRLLKGYLAGNKTEKDALPMYEQISRKASEQEKRASEAERSSIKYKQVEYMSSRIGAKLNGVISGINEWGIYLEDVETKSEGMVRMRDISDDFYVFNEKKLEIKGQKKKKSYRLGDRVQMKVKKVDLERKTIDYVLI